VEYNGVTQAIEPLSMFTKEMVHGGHTTRFSVTPSAREGWELRVERDSRLVRRAHYTDWHRLERAVSTLSMEVEMEQRGWSEPVEG
jgi:hypothetical protein